LDIVNSSSSTGKWCSLRCCGDHHLVRCLSLANTTMWNEYSAHSDGRSLSSVHGSMVEDDFEELFGRSHLRQLWFLFLAINTRSNPTQPSVMRKRDLVQLMRQARVVVPRSSSVGGSGGNDIMAIVGQKTSSSSHVRHPLAAPLVDADVDVIHTSETSRCATKKFTWTPFLRALVATSRKLYGQRAPGGEPHALQLLLEVNVLPHTTHLVASFVGSRARGFMPSVDKLLSLASVDSAQQRSRASSIASEAGDEASNDGPHPEGTALMALLTRFGPSLKDLFSYFAQVR